MKYSFCKYKVVGRKKVERRKIDSRYVVGTSKVRLRNIQGIGKLYARYMMDI